MVAEKYSSSDSDSDSGQNSGQNSGQIRHIWPKLGSLFDTI